jgi:N6-L-threonylcarbamoyladenine synthase
MELVYVLNKDGKPIMPCSSAKARKLLRDGKAKVVRRRPGGRGRANEGIDFH